MKLSSKQIMQAMDEKNLCVQNLTQLLNRYKGINVKDDDLRLMFSIDDFSPVEPHLRLILNLCPNPSFNPKMKPYSPKMDYNKRMETYERAQVYEQNNHQTVNRIIAKCGGYKTVAKICGLTPATVSGWSNKVTIDGIMGIIPRPNRNKLRDYAKLFKIKLTKDELELLKPEPPQFKYIYKMPSGNYCVRMPIDGVREDFGTHATLDLAILKHNRIAKKHNMPLHALPEVSG